MASTYSTNLKIELQATGENSGTWGTITNTNLGTALEQAIVGYGNPNYASDANLTLTYTDTNAAQAARALVLNVTSGVSLTGTRELVVPTIQKQYIVQNNTTGSQSITVKTSAGTGITVPNGRKAHLYVNGTDVIYMDDYVDINGGAIDGTPIGANSASTGAFSTLSASGNVTLSGGTANGVLYLNASKVATSGSALTFDGDALTLGGTAPRLRANMSGTQSTRFAIQNSTTDGNTRFFFYPNGTGSVSAIQGWNTSNLSATDYQLFDFGIISTIDIRLTSGVAGSASYLPITFYNGGGEKMRLDSSGRLGLNTTPGTGSGLFSLAYTSASLYSTAGAHPGAADTAFCGTYAINPSATTGAFASNLLYVRNGSSVYQSAGMSAVSVAGVGSGYSPNLNFWAQDGASTFATRMTIDAAGNLGLGVTPSAWWSGGRVIQVGNKSSLINTNTQAIIGHNWYYDGSNNRYIDSGFASFYQQASSVHSWHTAASGTAGNTITFTQAMTLDASGNLGIGTASPASRLHVVDALSGGQLLVANDTANAAEKYGTFGTQHYTNAEEPALGMAVQSSATENNVLIGGALGEFNAATNVRFYTAANNTTTAGTERMRIDSSGNVGIGGTATATDKVGIEGVLPSSGTGSNGYAVRGTIPSASTGGGNAFISRLTTSAASFTASVLRHFYANPSAKGAASSITDQYGFAVAATLTDATNNYGFHSDIASGSNRWNFYAAGTARNYFAGGVEDANGNLRKIPQSGSAKTGSYTLATTDVGLFIEVGSGGSITVPNSTFSAGDVVSIFNNTSGNVTLTMSITTAYIGGTDADKNTITLATRGVATILFISGTVCVVNGNVS
jgi:hypothetical protein